MGGFSVGTADGRLVVAGLSSYGAAWDAACEAADRSPGLAFFVAQDGCVLAATETRVDGEPGF